MTDDLQKLIFDLEHAPENLMKNVRQVVSKGALNIKTAWRESWSGHPHIKHLPRAIGYDLEGNAYYSAATIGVNEDNSQAPLAHIIEYGSPKSAPIPGGQHALDAEEPKFIRALEDLVGKSLDG